MKATPILNLLLAAVALGSAQAASAAATAAPAVRARGSTTEVTVSASKKATVGTPFAVKVTASNKRGIKRMWITFQDRIYSHNAGGKKNVTLSWKVAPSEAGRHPILVVAQNDMGDKTTKKHMVTVSTSKKKRPKGPTHLSAKPPACSKGVDAAMDHCDAKAGLRSAKYADCMESSFYKRCLKKKKKIAATKIAVKTSKAKKGAGITKITAKTGPVFTASALLDAIPQYLVDRPPGCKETTETWGNNTEGGITHTDCEGCFYEQTWTATEITVTVGCCDTVDDSTVDCVTKTETKPRPPS